MKYLDDLVERVRKSYEILHQNDKEKLEYLKSNRNSEDDFFLNELNASMNSLFANGKFVPTPKTVIYLFYKKKSSKTRENDFSNKTIKSLENFCQSVEEKFKVKNGVITKKVLPIEYQENSNGQNGQENNTLKTIFIKYKKLIVALLFLIFLFFIINYCVNKPYDFEESKRKFSNSNLNYKILVLPFKDNIEIGKELVKELNSHALEENIPQKIQYLTNFYYPKENDFEYFDSLRKYHNADQIIYSFKSKSDTIELFYVNELKVLGEFEYIYGNKTLDRINNKITYDDKANPSSYKRKPDLSEISKWKICAKLDDLIKFNLGITCYEKYLYGKSENYFDSCYFFDKNSIYAISLLKARVKRINNNNVGANNNFIIAKKNKITSELHSEIQSFVNGAHFRYNPRKSIIDPEISKTYRDNFGYKRALEIDSNFSEAIFCLAKEYSNTDIEKSYFYYSKLINKSRTNEEKKYYLNRFIIEIPEKQYPFLKNVISENSNFMTAEELNEFGLDCVNIDSNVSLKCFELSYEISQKFYLALYNKACVLYYDFNKIEEAYRIFNEISEIPNSNENIKNLRYSYHVYEEPLNEPYLYESLGVIVEEKYANDFYFESFYNKTMILYHSYRSKEALKSVNKALAIFPNNHRLIQLKESIKEVL